MTFASEDGYSVKRSGLAATWLLLMAVIDQLVEEVDKVRKS